MTGKGKDKNKHKNRHSEGEIEEAREEGSSEQVAEQTPPEVLEETQVEETSAEGLEKPRVPDSDREEKEAAVPGPEEARAEGTEEEKKEIAGGPSENIEEAVEAAIKKTKAISEVKVAEWRDRYLRLAADFDNFRKRQMKERTEILMTANEGLVVELLPVLDNMERAITALPKECGADSNFESIRKGVELTLRLFQAVLVKYGVERMTVVGTKFDPFKHEALAQEESADVNEDTVVEEIESGYLLNGKVVRPAKVKVAKPKP